jgi:hypoxanthine phosphoribosyltransferase
MRKETIEMKEIEKVVDKVLISEEKIKECVKRLASEINKDYEGQEPLFLVVLNGSFIFAADLMREITLPAEVSFVKLASYQGTASTGTVREVIGLNTDITGRPIIIVEDIVESGVTMAHMIATLKKQNPKSIDICTLLLKPEKMEVQLDIRYVAMEIPNDFIVGYGLDYNEQGRNLKDIYTIKED